MPSGPNTTMRPNPLVVIVVLSVLFRLAIMARGPSRFDDPDNYLPMARSLESSQSFTWKGRPTAYRPPLYPVMLVPAIRLGERSDQGVALLHLALGAATVWLTAVAARGLGLSPRRVLAAAFIVAFDPVLAWQCRSVMTETPAAFLVALSLAGLARGGLAGAALGGLGFGLSGLCRPSLLAGAVLTAAAGLAVPPGAMRERMARSSLVVATVVACLLPWMVRNLAVLGEPIWTTTHGGYTLALANNPTYYREVLDGPPGRVWTGEDQWRWWDSVRRETAGMSEPRADRYLQASVWKLARARPWDFARASLARLEHFWSVAPSSAVYPAPARWATISWTVPLWLAFLLGLPRSIRSWPWVAAPMVIIGLSAVHTVFWTDLRMRAPIVPAIALVAALAWTPRPSSKQ